MQKKLVVFMAVVILLVAVLGGVASAIPVPSGPPQGTYTIGYWKTHSDKAAGLLPIYLGTPGGDKSVMVSTSKIAVSYLSMSGGASNGIVKLYAQLLAAKLNIYNGASNSAVYSVINTADRFLATHDASSWSSLSKADASTVLSWMTTLDNYNNGVIGPGHAS